MSESIDLDRDTLSVKEKSNIQQTTESQQESIRSTSTNVAEFVEYTDESNHPLYTYILVEPQSKKKKRVIRSSSNAVFVVKKRS